MWQLCEGLTIWYQSFDLAPRTRLVGDIMVELELKDQIADLLTAIRGQTVKIDSLSGSMEALEAKVEALDELGPVLRDMAQWRPSMDQAVGALRADLGDLRLRIDRIANPVPNNSAATATTSPVAGLADLRPEAGDRRSGDEERHGPFGRRVEQQSRGSLMGVPPLTTPNKGTFDFPPSSAVPSPREREEV